MSALGFDIFAKDHASAVFEKFGKKVDESSGKFSKFGKAATVAVSGAGIAAVAFAKKSIDAYVESTAAQRQLQDAYARFPKLGDVNIATMRALGEEVQKKTGYDHNAVDAAEAGLAQYGLTGKQITDLIPLVADYAAKTGKTLPEAEAVLGKAMLGKGRALAEIGIRFKDLHNPTKNYAELMTGLRTQVGGFADKEGKSAAGQAKILSANFRDVEEKVGQRLLPALAKLTTWAIGAMDWMQKHATLMKIIVVGLAGFAAVVGTIIGLTKVWTAVQIALNIVMSANPFVLISIAVVALAVLIVLKWKLIKEWTVRIFTDIWSFMKAHWKLIVSVVTGPVGALVVFIVTHWTQIKTAVLRLTGDILTFIKGVPGKILGYFSQAATLLLRAGQAILQGLWNGARTMWANVSRWFGGVYMWIVRFGSDAGGWLLGAGKAIVRGLWDGISSMGEWLWDKVKSFIPGWIKDALGIHSPPDWAVDAGRWIARGLAKGIEHFPNFLTHLADAARKKLAGAVSGAVSIGGPNVSDLISGMGGLPGWIAKAMKLTGVGGDWFAPLIRRVMYESGGNPRAINLYDENAKAGHPSMGLMQTIASTFAAYALPGHGDVWNPVDNAAAAIRYIQSRYGSIMAIDPPVSGYKSGAWNIERDKLAMVHQREMIIPAAQAEAIRRGGDRGGGVSVNITINAGLGTDGAALGRQVAAALEKYSGNGGTVRIAGAIR